MSRLPWIKFYFTDWQADPGLRLCSRGARSFLLDLMAIMHQADPYGYLLVHGEKPTVAITARLTQDTVQEAAKYLAELVGKGVLSVREDGVLFSRKMVRDEEKRRISAESGRRGGNPALKRGVKGGDKDTLSPRGQRPDNKGPLRSPLLSGGDPPTTERVVGSPPETPSILELKDPRFTTFRKLIGPIAWAAWFEEVELSDETGALWAPSKFASERIEVQFGVAYEKVFGRPIVVRASSRGGVEA